jgi:hypothetical protein
MLKSSKRQCELTIFIDRDLVLISLVVGFLVAGLVVVVGLVVGLN